MGLRKRIAALEETVQKQQETINQITQDLKNPKPALSVIQSAVEKSLSQHNQPQCSSIPFVTIDLESDAQIFRKKP